MAYATTTGHPRGFPYGGQMMFRSDIADSHYDAATDAIVIHYMGSKHAWLMHEIISDNQRYERQVSDFLDRVYYSHQKGKYHVPWQSPQDAASGAPVAASPGTFGTNQLTAQQSLAYQHIILHQPSIPVTAITSYFADYYEKPAPVAVDGVKLGEIIGWRGWKIGPQGFLHSMTANVLWAPGEPMEGKVKAGAEHNGIYAYKVGRDFLKKHAGSLDVYGKIAMWGRVIEHELGYRAEFARIVSLEEVLRPTPSAPTIEDLRKRYGLG